MSEFETVWHGAIWRDQSPIPQPSTSAPKYAPKVRTYEKCGLILRAMGDAALLRRTIIERTGLTQDQVGRALTLLVQRGQVRQIGKRHSGRVMYRRVM